MLYIIGLGLNEEGISLEGMEIAKKCKKVYLENYTIEFPYTLEKLEEVLDKKIIPADREFVESLQIIDEARKMDIALLVYGSPLTATTHITLLNEAKLSDVKCKVIYSASILDGIAESGLQLYKFGKITSLPKFEAESFIEVIKENQSIGAHSLVLIDIGLDFEEAIENLIKVSDKNNVKVNKLVVCSRLGCKGRRICYDNINNLKSLDIQAPFCFIIPGKLHFMEKEVLESF